MTYRIARDGTIYGPYNAAEVERYLASGHIVPTDLIQANGAEEWLPVSELFPDALLAEAAPPSVRPLAPPLYPDPPDMPWWIALVLGTLTLGAFFVIWDIVQAAWLRRVDRSSTAVGYYVAVAVVYLIKLQPVWRTVQYNLGGDLVPSVSHHSGLVFLVGVVLFFVSRFIFRSELLRHFNGAEPIGLRLGWFMTLIFGGVYFQYHFNRINELKRALHVSVPTA